jgi:hypothetical protein
MPECDYCGETFDGERAYLGHLRDDHAEDLGPIDRRRVRSLDGDDDGGTLRPVAAVVGAVAVGAVFVWVAAGGGGLLGGGAGGGGGTGDGGDGLAGDPLPDRGDEALLSAVERHPSEGTTHVDSGTEVEYGTTPPTSGPHYASTVAAGFYEETPALGSLVHTLEHGAVVVYYDPGALTPAARGSLRAWAGAHTGTWRSVVVVPHPSEDPDAPYVLTAWRTTMRLEEYDEERLRAFVAEYLGRGPENPVR